MVTTLGQRGESIEDLITLPTVSNEHALKNRLNVEQIAAVLPIVIDQYPFYAPMI